MLTLSSSNRLSGSDFARLRAQLPQSDAEVAELLETTSVRLAEYASGTRTVSTRMATALRWHAGQSEREAALRASGLPECAAYASLITDIDRMCAQCEPENGSAMLRELTEKTRAVSRHAAACPVCLARQRHVDERFGPMPPEPGPNGIVRILAMMQRVPESLRPAALGAVLLGVIVGVRLALMSVLTLIGRRSMPGGEWLAMLGALGAAMAAGAAGGLIYAIARPLKRFGRPGQYALGVLVVSAYMGLLTAVAPHAFGTTLIHDTSEGVIVAIVAIFFGLVVGRSWFND